MNRSSLAWFHPATTCLSFALVCGVPALAPGQGSVVARHVVSVDVPATAGIRWVSGMTVLATDPALSVYEERVGTAANVPFGLQIRLASAADDSVSVRLVGGAWLALDADAWLDLADLATGVHSVAIECRVSAGDGSDSERAAPTLAYRAVVRQGTPP